MSSSGIRAWAEDRPSQYNVSTASARVRKQNTAAVLHVEVIQRQEVVKLLCNFQNALFFRDFFDVARTLTKCETELKKANFGKMVGSQSHIATNNDTVSGANELDVLGAANFKVQAAPIRDRLGADFRSTTSQEVERFGLGSKQGVVVIWIDPIGPLAKVGFEVNDMILEINGQIIRGLGNFVNLVNDLRPQSRTILLGLDHRTGRSGYVQVMIGLTEENS